MTVEWANLAGARRNTPPEKRAGPHAEAADACLDLDDAIDLIVHESAPEDEQRSTPHDTKSASLSRPKPLTFHNFVPLVSSRHGSQNIERKMSDLERHGKSQEYQVDLYNFVQDACRSFVI